MPSARFSEVLQQIRHHQWDEAHLAVQDDCDPLACWIHAVLHKIEPDAFNSRYWYSKTSCRYEDFSDLETELKAIEKAIST